MTYRAADFQQALAAIAPTGRVWPRDIGSTLMGVFAGLGPIYERNALAATGLIADALPTQTVNLLPEWEASLGLPDYPGINLTLAARRAAVAAKWAARGGQSVAYFINVAATLGYTITITEFRPFQFGQTFGLPLLGTPWAHAWQVNVPTYTVKYFQFGQDAFGEPFASYAGGYLLWRLVTGAPAQTVVLFNFSAGAPIAPLGDFILNVNALA